MRFPEYVPEVARRIFSVEINGLTERLERGHLAHRREG